jgi:hypothetical protein
MLMSLETTEKITSLYRKIVAQTLIMIIIAKVAVINVGLKKKFYCANKVVSPRERSMQGNNKDNWTMVLRQQAETCQCFRAWSSLL